MLKGVVANNSSNKGDGVVWKLNTSNDYSSHCPEEDGCLLKISPEPHTAVYARGGRLIRRVTHSFEDLLATECFRLRAEIHQALLPLARKRWK